MAGVEMATLDGALAPVSETALPITDGGLLRGDGIFEVMKLYEGKPFTLAEHLDRLERSGQSLRIDVDRSALEGEISRVLAARGESNGLLRIVVTREGRRIVMTEPPLDLPRTLELAVVTYEPSLLLTGVKSLSYAGNWLATRLARERGFHDALLVRRDDTVLEAPTSAMFWAKDDELFTPPLDAGILASVTRKVIIECCPVEERDCSLRDVLDADEIFLASVSREVQPVSKVEGVDYPAEGPVTARSLEAFHDVVRAELGIEPAQAHR